nr:hypothetical protein [uncultured Butyrivibrio sp.]
MKLFVRENQNLAETEVEIRCRERDGEVENLISAINLFCGYVVSALAASQVGAVAMVLIFLMLLPVMAVFNVKKLKKTEDFFKGISF